MLEKELCDCIKPDVSDKVTEIGAFLFVKWDKVKWNKSGWKPGNQEELIEIIYTECVTQLVSEGKVHN